MNGDHFGLRLRALRLARGLSMRALGQRMGVPHAQIARWETVSYAPKQQTLERLATALECPVTELFRPGSEAFTTKIMALEDALEGLRAEMMAVRAERDQLRAVVASVWEAYRVKDQAELTRAWMALLNAASSVEFQRMDESVDSIGEPQEKN